jgi:pSer/pThr/pTyr-binding forkhead associated (FHA) protein
MEHPSKKQQSSSVALPVFVKIERGKAQNKEFHFTTDFRIGRDETCEIVLRDSIVSKHHAEVCLVDGRWLLRDLNSTNGTFFNNQAVVELSLEEQTRVTLGDNGPVLLFRVNKTPISPPVSPVKDSSVDSYVERYFSDAESENIGEHTRLIRRAYREIQQKEKSKYARIIVVVGLLCLVMGVYAVYQHYQSGDERELAEKIFYSMKEIELELTRLENAAMATNDAKALVVISRNKKNLEELELKYDHLIEELDVYSKELSEQDRLIFRIARIFGECELTMPADFVKEVYVYIEKWKSSGRLQRAIRRAKVLGFTPKIAQKMLEYHLPPQFFYLALQESNFNPRIVGPKTRYGYAKGIWQFIPHTAARYNLQTGPLVEIDQYDPRDERFNFGKATAAAARYIRDIYDTDAQASGLLVMASYNWGERKILPLIRQMPNNPRERNFWQLLKSYKKKIPQETYDYVFYIISAAVIGENPRLFGFDFDNPFASASQD